MTTRMSLGKAAPPTAAAIRARLRALADPRSASPSQRFFKTAPGEYGHGDRFLGISMPAALALLILVARYARGTAAEQQRIFEQYLKHVPKHVNNWDLVDSSAHYIVGAHLAQRDRSLLYELARSPHLWSRRVAIIATFWFIKQGSFEDTLAIAEQLLGDREDLLHKAAGWMLREVGNRDAAAAERFLRCHCRRMPRTMLRYAIEKLPERTRRAYLDGTIRKGDGFIFRGK